jgi:sugar lactone lactonase YvrE
MCRLHRGALVVPFLVVAIMLGPAASAGGAFAVPGGGQFITTFTPGSFPESLAVDGSSLYTSLGFSGQLVKVTAGGAQTVVASLDVGHGLITGIAVAADGALYVADATFPESLADPAPGVFRVDPGTGTTSRILTLPQDSFPNGLALHDGYLYVADSNGPIWRTDPGTVATLAAPWFENALLAPGNSGFGSNGIAFHGDTMYVAVSDFGRIVAIPVTGGPPSSPTVAAQRLELRSADGIAFDVQGGLYIAVNRTNRLYRLAPDGALERMAGRSDGLSYPTMPAFGRTRHTRTTLYLSDGAFLNGIPGIQSFDVGAGGLPLS